MSFNIVSARLTASPNSLGWSQVHEFTPQDKDKLEKRGRLYAVISTKKIKEKRVGGQTIDSVSAGREVLSRLHEEYFGRTVDSSFEALKNAVTKVVEEFGNGQELIEIIAVAHVEGVIYTTAAGGARLAILREGGYAKILASKGKEVVTASGYPKEGDVLILGTSAFYDKFAEGVIRGSLEGKDIRKAAEYFAPSIHASDANPDLGVSLLKFQKASEEDVIRNIGTKDSLSEGELPEHQKDQVGESAFEERHLQRDKLVGSDKAESTAYFGKKDKSILGRIKKVASFRGRGVYVRQTEEPLESKKRRKVSASVGVVLVITLLVSVVFGIKQKEQNDYRMQYSSELKDAQHLLDESLSLYTIDTGRSRELFNQSRDIIDKLIADGIEDEEVETLSNRIKERQGEILGEYKAQVENFSDLTIITSGFSGKSVVGYGEEIYVSDSEGERIVSITVGAKKSKVEIGPAQLSGVADFAVYSDRIFIANDEGVFEVTKISKDEVAKKDWSGDILLSAYTSNLYLLEKNGSNISRYASTESGFANKKTWLADDVVTDFSDVVDWAIDGTIWVLSGNGEIERYSQGNKLSFSIKGLAPQLTGGDAIYTSEETKYLYILDSVGGRVVVIDKEGDFQAQYLAQELSGAKGIVVAESEGKIIILKEGKLLSIEIKHL